MTERTALVEEVLARRLEAMYPDRETVRARLVGSEKLTIYLGIDPTGADLHLGHTIPLLVLRDIAKLGHDAVLLIGDFTARIGDPTGKNAARTALTTEEVAEHMASYVQQAERIIPSGTFRVVYNSEWLAALSMSEVLRLTGMMTVQQMIQRDMFQARLKEGKPIYLNEFLYPLMQGYDSVALRTDGEIGGSDQIFNMLVGRELEKELLGKDKIVLATKLLVDTMSGKKMSKSEGSLITVRDSAQEIRRKVLAVDDMMVRSLFLLCTDIPMANVDRWQREGERPTDPRSAKEALAAELIRMFHGERAVREAEAPQEIDGAGRRIDHFVAETQTEGSVGAARRLVEQGGVRVNGEQVARWDIVLKSGDEVRVGKGKFFRIK